MSDKLTFWSRCVIDINSADFNPKTQYWQYKKVSKKISKHC